MSRTELIPTITRRRVLMDKIMSDLILVAVVLAVSALHVILADTLIKGLTIMSL